MSAPNKTYDAFISYAHAQDQTVAEVLERDLRRFARPWNRLWAVRVYRDVSNLSVSPDLWRKVEAALLDAKFLILLASPTAAASKWVTREVDAFLSQNGPERLLIVLTAGQIEWNARKKDFNWSSTTALPRCLEGKLSSEPKFLDLRWAAGRATEALRGGPWMDAAADLSSVLQDRPKDELFGEDARQRRRQKVIVRGSVAALVAAPALTLAASIYFSQTSQNEADQRIAAEVERGTARALNIVQAEEALDRGDYATAFELFEEAMRGRQDETRSAIQARFDLLLQEALREDASFELRGWRMDYTRLGIDRFGSRSSLRVKTLGATVKQRIEDPLAYLDTVHAEYRASANYREPDEPESLRYVEALVAEGAQDAISFASLLGDWTACWLAGLSRNGFTLFPGAKGAATVAVRRGRVTLEIENNTRGVDPTTRYSLARVDSRTLYAGTGSPGSISPGVAFWGPGGDLVLLVLGIYRFEWNSEASSYELQETVLGDHNRYWVTVCRR